MVQYTTTCQSPLGDITLAADGEALTGLWFECQKYYAPDLGDARAEEGLPVFQQAKAWLDTYFSGRDPGPTPPVHLVGTDFQREVWAILTTIPYGTTRTYGDIAQELARKRGLARMSAQAVGGAVGRNPISVIVPCHRVVGSNGSLTGYAGGIAKKVELLRLEGALKEGLFVPKHSTAP